MTPAEAIRFTLGSVQCGEFLMDDGAENALRAALAIVTRAAERHPVPALEAFERFTEARADLINAWFAEGRPAADIARDLSCEPEQVSAIFAACGPDGAFRTDSLPKKWFET